MRPWETEFVFVCEKEIFKRKSRSFSYLRSERHLCVRGGVRVAHRGIVERNETPGDEVCVCVRERDFTWRIIVRHIAGSEIYLERDRVMKVEGESAVSVL